MNPIIAEIEKEQMKADLPAVKSGDEVSLHLKVVEGEKERIQVFSGTVIGLSGRGPSRMITVRKISHGEGVERVVPLHAPVLQKLEVVKPARKTSRAKLYHLRDKK